MRAIGVDPGISNSGLSVVNWDRQRYALSHAETITTAASLEIPARVSLICEKVSDAIQTFNPDLLAIEGVYFNKNVSSAISTAIVIGACVQIANDANIPLPHINCKKNHLICLIFAQVVATFSCGSTGIASRKSGSPLS